MTPSIVRATFLGILALIAGCYSQPVPLDVHQGSTFTLNLSNALDPGYRSLITEAEGDLDEQRGQVVPLLCPVGEADCTRNTPESGTGYPLIVNYITSFDVNRASPAGVRNGINYESLRAPPRPIVIALLDVPLNTPPETYDLQLRIDRGQGAGLEPFLGAIDFGTITVLETQPGESVTENRVPVADPGSQTTLYELVPYPKLEVKFDLSNTLTRAAAADIQIEYPIERLRIVSAHEVDQLGQASLVRLSHVLPGHSLDPGVDPILLDCATNVDTLYLQFCLNTIQGANTRYAVRIRLVDPDLLTKILGLVFALRDTAVTVATSEFDIVAQDSYDIDGLDLSPLTWAITSIR